VRLTAIFFSSKQDVSVLKNLLRSKGSLMSSLVLELQQEAMTAESRLTDVLRKALVVASKLHVEEFRDWIQKELHGYKPEDSVPEYRHIKGEIKTRDPINGWIPFVAPDVQTAETMAWKYITQPVAQIEHLLEKYRGKDLLYVPYGDDVAKRLTSHHVPASVIPTLVIHQSRVYAIVDCVRTLVLEWSLELERENIMGNRLTFSKREKQRAASVSFKLQAVTDGSK
jgi:hypothetical protein